jgi:hypothetical protein
MGRIGGLVSFLFAALWAYRYEALRAYLYGRGFDAMSSMELDSLLHWGVPLALAGLGLVLFWKTGGLDLGELRRLEWPWGRRILILDAARTAFETAERLGIEKLLASSTDPAEEKLSWVVSTFLVRKFKIWGRQPPSRNLKIITEQELAGLLHVPGTNSLKSNFASSPFRYEDVQVDRADVRNYVNQLHRLSKMTEDDF